MRFGRTYVLNKLIVLSRRRRPVTTEPADPNPEDQEGPEGQEGHGDQQGDQIEGEGDQDELQSGRSGSRRYSRRKYYCYPQNTK